MEEIIKNSYQEPPQIQPKRRWYKKWWVILVLGFIIYFLIIVTLLSIGSKESKLSFDNLTVTDSENFVDENQLYLHSENDPQIGQKGAKVRIVEFSDFQCQFCREAFGTVREIISKYNDQIYFVYRDFPISDIHPFAQRAAEAAQCANEQDMFWPMHDKLFINQDSLSNENIDLFAEEIGLNSQEFNQCLSSGKYSSEVIEDLLDGRKLGVNGTPTFFINGYRISGVIPRDIFINLVEQGLKE